MQRARAPQPYWSLPKALLWQQLVLPCSCFVQCARCPLQISTQVAYLPAVCVGLTTQVGLESIDDPVVQQNLKGRSRFMDKKGWVDPQGRKGKVRHMQATVQSLVHRTARAGQESLMLQRNLAWEVRIATHCCCCPAVHQCCAAPCRRERRAMACTASSPSTAPTSTDTRPSTPPTSGKDALLISRFQP